MTTTDIESANQGLADARKKLEAAEALAVVAEGRLLEQPDDARADASADAHLAVERAMVLVEAWEKRLHSAEAAQRQADAAADAAELVRLERDLCRNPYVHELDRLAELGRAFQAECIEPLLAKQNDRIAKYDRAEFLARRLGDLGWRNRNPRPRRNEAEMAARIVMGRVLAVAGALANVADTFLTPINTPSWKDGNKPMFDQITALIDQKDTAE